MDRETIVKGIQECDLKGGLIGNCPYKGILTLLKEQEAKLVRIDEDSVHCPSCGNELFTYPRQKFCDECGQAVKWDG